MAFHLFITTCTTQRGMGFVNLKERGAHWCLALRRLSRAPPDPRRGFLAYVSANLFAQQMWTLQMKSFPVTVRLYVIFCKADGAPFVELKGWPLDCLRKRVRVLYTCIFVQFLQWNKATAREFVPGWVKMFYKEQNIGANFTTRHCKWRNIIWVSRKFWTLPRFDMDVRGTLMYTQTSEEVFICPCNIWAETTGKSCIEAAWLAHRPGSSVEQPATYATGTDSCKEERNIGQKVSSAWVRTAFMLAEVWLLVATLATFSMLVAKGISV